jgi:nitroreductase
MEPRTLAGLGTDEVDACIIAAISAPSIFNTQPWCFRVRQDSIDLFADLSRQLHVVDPDGRELSMSVGAALLNLRVALLSHGRRPLTRLLPGDAPALAARVRCGPVVVPNHSVRALAAAVPRRRTNRLPYARTPIPADVIDELRASAAAEGARLHLLNTVSRNAVFAIARSAQRTDLDEAYRRELAEWTHGIPGRRDGLPPSTIGPPDATGRLPLRDFTPGVARDGTPFEPHPQIAVLTTDHDGPLQWLRSGQALQRVLLTATVRGIAAQPITQPLEVPRLRQLMAGADRRRFPQAIIRLGYGTAVAEAPRRPVTDVLVR